jgi:ribonuclease HII
MPKWLHTESDLRKRGYRAICGVDEAGRGPLAGPVVAAAVILPPKFVDKGIDDSKRLTPTQREYLSNYIIENCFCCAIASASSDEIDQINILQATFGAMRMAINQLATHPDFILVDGNAAISKIDIPQLPIVKGDQKVLSIACASILAKVYRDRLMLAYHRLFPEYGFDRHKGYPTKEHRSMIEKHGPIAIHRKSFTLLTDQRELDFGGEPPPGVTTPASEDN